VEGEGGPAGKRHRSIGLLVAALVLVSATAVGLAAARSRGSVPRTSSPSPTSTPPAHTTDTPLPTDSLQPPPPSKPDIYYILLDEYSGRRALQAQFGFDNNPFYEALRARGLYVADHATTNYPRTALSLAASLNLDYVQQLVQPVPEDQSDYAPIDHLIHYPEVPGLFQLRGYTYDFLGSWWLHSNPEADDTIALGDTADEAANLGIQLQAFEGVGSNRKFNFDQREYVRVQFQFAELAKLKDAPGPKFVFAHFTCPHAPFVFAPDGSFVGPTTSAMRTLSENYPNQIRYLNTKVLALVDDLLSLPEGKRPVIIIQSDEGFLPGDARVGSPDPIIQAAFGILAAFSLPGVPDSVLYPTITPVNVFRLVLDQYFDAGLPLLPDRNYVFPDLDHRYTYVDVTDQARRLAG
jgi:hypothetical protein